MANAPSPLNGFDILVDGEYNALYVQLLTAAPNPSVFQYGTSFVAPSDINYADQETEVHELTDFTDSLEAFFEKVSFSGEDFLAPVSVVGYLVYATYDDCSPLLGYEMFVQPLVLGPSTKPIAIDPYVDLAELQSAVPINVA